MSGKGKSALSQPPAPERRLFERVRTTPLRLVVKPT
jgi:hypothetical protein